MWKKNIVFRNFFFASIILVVLMFIGISIIMARKVIPDVIPLYYGKPTGSEQLVEKWFFFLIPCISMIITIINFLISLYIRDDLIKKVFAVSALVISIMAFISVVKIIFLVGFF